MADYVDSNPGQDTFFDLANKFNNNADLLPVSFSQSNGTVTLNLAGGGAISFTLPPGVDKILSGLSTSIIGTGPYQIEYQPGTYNISGAEYEILSIGQINIPAADVTFDTIHTVVVDTAEMVSLITGTPSANPVAPTVGSGQILVTYIYVPASDIPIQQGGNASIPDGIVDGDTLRWKAAISQWVRNPGFLHNEIDAILYAINSLKIKVTSAGVENHVFIDGSGIVIKRTNSGSTEHEIRIDDFGITLDQTVISDEKPLVLNMKGGAKIIDNVPTDTLNVLYNDGGYLWFNGQLLCTAPCGVAEKNTVTVVDSDYSANPDTEKIIICYNDSNGGTITLPAFPSDNAELLIIADGQPTADFSNIIDSNGNLIAGTTALSIPTGKCAIKIAWNNVDNWVVTSIEARPENVYVQASITPSYYAPFHFGDTNIFCYTDAAMTINLPIFPADGQRVVVCDTGSASTNNILVDGGAYDISPSGGPYTIDYSFQSLVFVFNADQGVWEIASGYKEQKDDFDNTYVHVTPAMSPYSVDTNFIRYVMANTASGTIEIDLPASPNFGDKVVITDVGGNAATNNITIDGNGNNVVGSASFIMNNNYQSIALKFVGGAWFSVAG